MYKGKRILCTINARGGSKGIPGKNIRELAGLPLIAWSIRAGLASRHIDRVIVSSDDEAIRAAARAHGAETPFERPAELAQDDTPGVDPVLHAVEALHRAGDGPYDYVVLLQPTSPLRGAQDVDGAIELCLDNGWPCVISVAQPEKSPYFMFTQDQAGRLSPVIAQQSFHTRRQTLPRVVAPNGAVYVADCSWLARTKSYLTEETRGYEMPRARSWDIDEPLDFEICELLLKKAGRTQ